jgi:hypothetical protein
MERVHNERAYADAATAVLRHLFGGGRFTDREVHAAVHNNDLSGLFAEKGMTPRGTRIANERIDAAYRALG